VTGPFKSFIPPFTASGRSAIVPPPPWHYAGWLINVGFTCDTAEGHQFVPPQLGRMTGTGCIHFADWQATTDGRELIDPVYAQYRETIVMVEIERPDGARYNFCPFIWVDQDVSFIRGLLQGWPKKLGTTYLTRSLPLEHAAAAPIKAGTRLGATLTVKDRRLIEADLTLTGTAGRPLGFLANKTIGTVAWPDLTQPQEPAVPAYILPDIRDKVASHWHAAEARLTVLPHPVEEISLLGSLKVEAASVGWAGVTIAGALPLAGSGG
jgi:hypothetical protein